MEGTALTLAERKARVRVMDWRAPPRGCEERLRQIQGSGSQARGASVTEVSAGLCGAQGHAWEQENVSVNTSLLP